MRWRRCSVGVVIDFFFKQKTAYEMRISDWSSDVCSSDLQRDGEYGAVAVNDVIAEDQRDLEPRALDRHALQLARIFGGIGVEDGADPARGDIILIAFAHRRAGRFPVAGEEVELPDLLVERHLRDHLGAEAVHLRSEE